MNIIYWNINSVCTKLEKSNVYEMLMTYDVIALGETKTCLSVSFPGYVSFQGKSVGSGERGGIVVFVKNYLSKFVCNVDVSIGDQIWLEFKNVEEVLFGFCYIPPNDSQYYSHDVFAAMQEKIKSRDTSNGYFIMGDLNARFGKAVRDMAELYELPGFVCSYPDIPDCTSYMNDNAEFVSTLCLENQLVVLNNLKVPGKHFLGGMTYRKRGTWVSELDTCVLSYDLIPYVNDFKIINRLDLPSDHAPICVSLGSPGTQLGCVLSRAELLGDHAVLYSNATQDRLTRKPIKFVRINKSRFEENLARVHVPNFVDDVNVFASRISESLYACAESSVCVTQPSGSEEESVHLGRWERLLDDSDDARVWKAINWKGDIEASDVGNDNRPSDSDFKVHFERLLNSDPTPPTPHLVTDVTIPVLDDPISTLEVQRKIRKLNVKKASGPDGLSPGILTMLPPTWILTLTTLFNNVFVSAVYPLSWIRAKIVAVFKKGDKSKPNNYRGISVINSIAKLYDMILSDRLGEWFHPYREQVGAQSKRSCTEHIATLRLLTDMARRKKLKLFITFIDFSKAYDLVPRQKLFSILKRMGCGMVMLAALMAMYRSTESVIGGAVVKATVGVRQGSPTSCLLFVVLMNELIRRIKERCLADGFLGWIHALVLMDDTTEYTTCTLWTTLSSSPLPERA